VRVVAQVEVLCAVDLGAADQLPPLIADGALGVTVGEHGCVADLVRLAPTVRPREARRPEDHARRGRRYSSVTVQVKESPELSVTEVDVDRPSEALASRVWVPALTWEVHMRPLSARHP